MIIKTDNCILFSGLLS